MRNREQKTEHIESLTECVALLQLTVLLYVCRFLTLLCVADPIWGVCRGSYCNSGSQGNGWLGVHIWTRNNTQQAWTCSWTFKFYRTRIQL